MIIDYKGIKVFIPNSELEPYFEYLGVDIPEERKLRRSKTNITISIEINSKFLSNLEKLSNSENPLEKAIATCKKTIIDDFKKSNADIYISEARDGLVQAIMKKSGSDCGELWKESPSS